VECGFLWVDLEWPEATKKAIARLWEMYDESNSAQMKKQIQCKKDVMALDEEKDEMESKYTNLMCDVKKWTVDTPKNVTDTMFWRCTDYPSFDIFNVPAKMCVCVCVCVCVCENGHQCKL
jgi:hypothetical protein